jgi:cytochrome c oxidase accessory protein FixG
MTDRPIQYYAKHAAVVPRAIHGPFRRFKSALLWLSFAVYFLLPWLPWSRYDGIPQAVVFDIPGRRYMLFDLVIYPQDVFWLALFLFIAAVLLFFVTALVGRAFCGYFCFQTLWTDAYIWVEHWLQGERPHRLKLARAPWTNGEKLLKVGATYLIWWLIAFWTALTFVLYFGYAPELLREFFTGTAVMAAYITVAVLSVTTYLSAATLREHVCLYICPYGRFQSAMYDPETLTVHYDRARGEGAAGRIAAKQGLRTAEDRRALGHGDCIDCKLCVQVCPTGIDIRDGMQLGCIACGLCIDACNTIMAKMHLAPGLVRYDAEINLQRAQPLPPRVDWRRLKVIGYGAALILMTAYLFYSIAHRQTFEHSTQQIRQPLFVVLSDGRIRNLYQIRLTNLSGHAQRYQITVRGVPPASLDLGNFSVVEVRNGKSVIVQASVTLSPEMALLQPELWFDIRNPAGEVSSDPARFFTQH